MLTDFIRKDLPLSSTIKNIKTILRKNSIRVKEHSFCVAGSFFSVRIEIVGLFNIGVNGKGVTKTAALASAYAELMERLQTGFLLRSPFLNKDVFFPFQREKILDSSLFQELVGSFFSDKLNSKVKELLEIKSIQVCSDFIDLNTKETVWIPHRLMNMVCKTNGLCAGNSYEEAVSQGICEILERYVHKKIILDDLLLPDIPQVKFDSERVASLLSKISKLGLYYQIKDCSLGGKYPVVGLLVYNHEKSRAIFTVGSDVDMNIALSRCILELFQGIKNKRELYAKLQPLAQKSNDKNKIWYDAFLYNRGAVSSKLFVNLTKNSEVFFNTQKLITNKDVLDFLLNLLIKQKKNVFIKDYSCLGFPTYRVYISKLTEVYDLSVGDLFLYKNLKSIRDAYFNLKNSSQKDLRKLVHMFELYKDFSQITHLDLFNTNGRLRASFGNVRYDFILLYSFLKLKEYNNFLELLKDMDIPPKIKKALTSMINDEKTENKEEAFISYFKLKKFFPNCPNCNECFLKKKCSYNKWFRYISQIYDVYSGWELRKIYSSADSTIFIEELRPEMTQCRLIQVEKNIGKG